METKRKEIDGPKEVWRKLRSKERTMVMRQKGNWS